LTEIHNEEEEDGKIFLFFSPLNRTKTQV